MKVRTMSKNARREAIEAAWVEYQRAATRQDKSVILDALTLTAGINRKYAIAALRKPPRPPKDVLVPQPTRRCRYGPESQAAVTALWEASGRLCSRRLVAFLPELCHALERHGHLALSPITRAEVLKMGHATVDRILAAVRYGGELAARKKRRNAAELRRQIPVRTFTEWGDAKAGECSADLVAHCGQVLEGSFLWTLVVTDIVTGWTEMVALMARDASTVVAALKVVRSNMPMPMIALHADNGSEFINQVLLRYCNSESLKFTRGRPYRKNDQCFVEQKNGHIIRRHVGFDRLTGLDTCRALNQLYLVLRLHNNYFQPCMKLESKVRDGSRVVKRYEPAKTPHQRLRIDGGLQPAVLDALQARFVDLDPMALLEQIHSHQQRLLALCVRAGHCEVPAEPRG